MPDLKAIDVELAVVRLGGALDGHPTTIMTAVAGRDLHRADDVSRAVVIEVGAERTHADEEPERRHRITENAPRALRLGSELSCKLGAEADAGDVEEGMAVDFAEIDPAGISGDDEARRCHRIRVNAESTSEVVGGAERQDAERQAGFDEGWGGSVEGAITPSDDDAVVSVGLCADHVRDRPLGATFLLCHLDTP